MNAVSEKKNLDCMICGNKAMETFPKEFQGIAISYYKCNKCNHLTANEFDPDELYMDKSYFTEVDHGWEMRNKRVLKFLNFFSRLPGIKLPLGIKALDYGCGIGSLVEDLAAIGNDAMGYEPFPNPGIRLENIITEQDQLENFKGKFQLVTMIEVIEHLREPGIQLREIKELLTEKGYLLISTGIFRENFHADEWFYLNPLAGHVSIYSEESIQQLLKEEGFLPIFRVNENLWLFRLAGKRNVLESLYFHLSNMRIQRKYKS